MMPNFAFYETVAAITVLVIAYLFLLRRLADVAQPVRLEMAEIGERLLASNISDNRKNQIKFYLDNAFCGYVAAAASLIFPLVVASVMVSKSARSASNAITTADEKKVALFFTVSIFVANPIAATLLILEFLLFGLVLFLVKGHYAVISAVMETIRAERSITSSRTRSA